MASTQQVEAALTGLFEATDADAARGVPVDPGATRLGPVSVSGTGNPFHPGGVVWGSGNPGGGDAVKIGIDRHESVRMLPPDPLRVVRIAAHDAVLAGVPAGDVHAAVNEGTRKAQLTRRDLAVVTRLQAPLDGYGLTPEAVQALAHELAAVALSREGLLDG
jgi:hypothetical protein